MIPTTSRSVAFSSTARSSRSSNASGRWASSPDRQSILFEAESQNSSRDFRGFNLSFGHHSSFSSNDADHHSQFFEPAYSFVGMHCIFHNCKASVTILKFGCMSSDLLAYGASDGSLVVCRVSEAPSVIQHLKGHSKAITDKTVQVWEISKGHCI